MDAPAAAQQPAGVARGRPRRQPKPSAKALAAAEAEQAAAPALLSDDEDAYADEAEAGAGDSDPDYEASSKYTGVTRSGSATSPWKAQISVGGTNVGLGCFSTEKEAAKMFNCACIGLGREVVNVLDDWHVCGTLEEWLETHSLQQLVRTVASLSRGDDGSGKGGVAVSDKVAAALPRVSTMEQASEYTGVTPTARSASSPWQALIKLEEKTVYLGSFATEERAAKAYDEALWEHRPGDGCGSANFPNAVSHGLGDLLVFTAKPAALDADDPAAKPEFRAMLLVVVELALDEVVEALPLAVEKPPLQSEYRGVFPLQDGKGAWSYQARVSHKKRLIFLGTFRTEKKAAEAHDTALWKLRPKDARSLANFPGYIDKELEDLLVLTAEPGPAALKARRDHAANPNLKEALLEEIEVGLREVLAELNLIRTLPGLEEPVPDNGFTMYQHLIAHCITECTTARERAAPRVATRS